MYIGECMCGKRIIMMIIRIFDKVKVIFLKLISIRYTFPIYSNIYFQYILYFVVIHVIYTHVLKLWGNRDLKLFIPIFKRYFYNTGKRDNIFCRFMQFYYVNSRACVYSFSTYIKNDSLCTVEMKRFLAKAIQDWRIYREKQAKLCNVLQ